LAGNSRVETCVVPVEQLTMAGTNRNHKNVFIQLGLIKVNENFDYAEVLRDKGFLAI